MSLPIPEAKLPMPRIADQSTVADLQGFSKDVLLQNMQNVRSSSAYLRRSFLTLYTMYVALFCLGLVTAVVAIVRGFVAQSVPEAVGAVAIAGLSASSFFALFLTQPLESLERNTIYSAWLTAVTNTYWTQLMYLDDPHTVARDLTRTTDELLGSLSLLADHHSKATGKAVDSAAAPK